MKPSPEERMLAAIEDYLVERDGGGYYVGTVDTTLPGGREVTALVRLEIAPRVPPPRWGDHP